MTGREFRELLDRLEEHEGGSEWWRLWRMVDAYAKSNFSWDHAYVSSRSVYWLTGKGLECRKIVYPESPLSAT